MGWTLLTEKRAAAPPVDAQKAVRWVEAQCRYEAPSTTSYLKHGWGLGSTRRGKR
jgi:hypothetical protein